MPAQTTGRLRRLAIGLALATLSVLGFASTFIFGSALTKDCGVSPAVLSFLRFSIAGVALLTCRPKLPQTRGDWRTILLLGPVGTSLMALFVFLGCARVSAANASMADALTPLMIFAVASLRALRIDGRGLLGLASGFLGAALVIKIITPAGIHLDAYSLGDVFILLSAATWGIYTVYGHAAIGRLGSSAFTAWTMLVGAVAIGAFLPFLDLAWPSTARSWSLVLALGLVSTLMPFWAWNAAQKYLPMGLLAVTAYFTPVFAVALAAVFLGERAEPLQWAGTVFIVLSAVIEIKREPEARRD